jgi:hypothetical protein
MVLGARVRTDTYAVLAQDRLGSLAHPDHRSIDRGRCGDGRGPGAPPPNPVAGTARSAHSSGSPAPMRRPRSWSRRPPPPRHTPARCARTAPGPRRTSRPTPPRGRPQSRDCRMIRRPIGGNHPKRHAIDAAVLDLVRRPHPLPVRVAHHRGHHRRVIRRLTMPIAAIGPIERGQIQLLERIEHKPRQMADRQPLPQGQRQQSRSHAMKFGPPPTRLKPAGRTRFTRQSRLRTDCHGNDPVARALTAAHDRVMASVNRPDAGRARAITLGTSDSPITPRSQRTESPRSLPWLPWTTRNIQGAAQRRPYLQGGGRGHSTAGRDPRPRRRGAGVQVETAASTTAAVAGTTYEGPLDTRVTTRFSGWRSSPVRGSLTYRDREIIRRREPSG